MELKNFLDLANLLYLGIIIFGGHFFEKLRLPVIKLSSKITLGGRYWHLVFCFFVGLSFWLGGQSPWQELLYTYLLGTSLYSLLLERWLK